MSGLRRRSLDSEHEPKDWRLIAFSRPFIANPDLVESLQLAAPLAECNIKMLYGVDTEGCSTIRRLPIKYLKTTYFWS